MQEPQDDIPPEIKAQAACGIFFVALREGDYASAARSQERLKELGWHLSREAPRPKPASARRRQPRQPSESPPWGPSKVLAHTKTKPRGSNLGARKGNHDSHQNSTQITRLEGRAWDRPGDRRPKSSPCHHIGGSESGPHD